MNLSDKTDVGLRLAIFLGSLFLAGVNYFFLSQANADVNVLPPTYIMILATACTLSDQKLKRDIIALTVSGVVFSILIFERVNHFGPALILSTISVISFSTINKLSKKQKIENPIWRTAVPVTIAVIAIGILFSFFVSPVKSLAVNSANVSNIFSAVFIASCISLIPLFLFPSISKAKSLEGNFSQNNIDFSLGAISEVLVAAICGFALGYILQWSAKNPDTLLAWGAIQVLLFTLLFRRFEFGSVLNIVVLCQMTLTGHTISGVFLHGVATVYIASSLIFSIFVADMNRKAFLQARKREAAQQIAIESDIKVKAYEAAVANLTHDLKTPAAQISGLLELIEEEVRDKADVSREIQMAKASARRLRTMIEDTLDVTRLEMGRSEVHAIAFNPADTLEKLVTSFRFTAELRKLELRFVNHLTVVSVLQDGQRLERIVSNLIDNAIKYTNDGHVTVTVANTPVAEGRSNLLIEVSDTGIGIPSEQLQNIFSKFERARNHHAIDGLGLGLALVASLVKMLGGTVTVTSQINSCTCFKVVLPCEVLEQATATTIPSISRATPDKPRILLVEDDPVSRELAGAMLKGMADITYAANGLEAVRTLEKDMFSMVIMDCRMPVMDGPSAAREIRQIERETGAPRTPIYGLTANASPEESRTAITAGMDRLLEKPLSMKLVKELLAS